MRFIVSQHANLENDKFNNEGRSVAQSFAAG